MAYTDIDKPSDYFETLTWSGNSTDDRAISGLDFAPNWVWIKCRNNGQNHNLFDTVRGATESLESNNDNAENTDTTSLKSFTSDGYTLGTGSTVNSSSPSTKTYVGWNWKAGTSFTNDASSTGIGSIDSTGSFNNDAGFSIVSFTGTGSNGTIKHGLSTAPKMLIIKRRSPAQSWSVYHASLGTNKRLYLDLTDAVETTTSAWNNTAPTSSVFSVGTSNATNGNGENMIAYCFAEKQGYSKFGSYTANNNSDGTYIHLGFKPAFFICKKSSGTETWYINDNKRSAFNPTKAELYASESQAEGTGNARLDLVSNGVKMRTDNGGYNTGSETYIYMAFAEQPFVTSSGVPATAR